MVRFVFVFIVFGFLGGISAQGASLKSAGKEDVRVFMNGVLQDAVASLQVTDKKKRQACFKEIVHRFFAMRSIAAYLIGNLKPGEDQDNLLRERLEDYVVKFYLDQFDAYGGALQRQDFVIGRIVAMPSSDNREIWSVGIKMTAQKKGGTKQEVDMDWRVFLSRDGVLKILDVYIAGISLSQTKRAEFKSTLDSRGVSGLIRELERFIETPAPASTPTA